MEAQLTAMKGWRERGESLWMAWASSSLPVPVSPRIMTGISLPQIIRSLWITLETCGSPVSRYCNDDMGVLRSGVCAVVLSTPSVAVPAVADDVSAAGAASAGLVDQSDVALRVARHQTVMPLCSTSCLGVGEAPLKSSYNADTGMPNNEEKVCALSAEKGRLIWNCALRLAEMKRPSGENTTMPSTRVPRNSDREWKWMRIALGKMSANMWFSIICVDMRTSASVW